MSRTCHNCQRRFNGAGFSYRFCGQPSAIEHHNKLLMNQRTSRQNDLATFLAYLKFRRRHRAYHDCIANQLRIFDWIDERRIVMETLTGFKRAGADMILTYHALDVARWLKQG